MSWHSNADNPNLLGRSQPFRSDDSGEFWLCGCEVVRAWREERGRYAWHHRHRLPETFSIAWRRFLDRLAIIFLFHSAGRALE